MSGTATEFEQLMQRVRAGCPEAAREVFERYSKPIHMIVRHNLNPRLRSQFDSLDFTQDAWACFFDVPAERYNFKTPQELVNFLAGIVHHKLIDAARQRLQSAKRTPHRLERLQAETDELAGNEPLTRQPTPSQVAIAEEQWGRLLQDQPPRVRRALEMLREGHTHSEIAKCLGLHPKMFQRVLQLLERKLDHP